MTVTVSVILVAAMMLTLSACGNELAGTWHSITSESGITITFENSGAVRITLGDFRMTGRYTSENGAIIMNLTDPQGDEYQFSMNYYIDGKKLYLENENGDIETFSK